MMTEAQLAALQAAPARPNRVKAAMTAVGLTQVQLAEAVGVTQSAISKVSTGETEPTLETAKRLAAFFGCAIEDLFPRCSEVA